MNEYFYKFSSEEIHKVELNKESTVLDLKKHIENKHFLTKDMYFFSNGFEYIQDTKTLENLDCTVLELFPIVYAGMRAKWKKKRTRRLKRKRRKMRQRAR